MAGWFFASVPKEETEDIQKHFGDLKRGWGSLSVNVTVGSTSWKTSIFPDKKSGEYLLPLKAEVRKKEGISENDMIKILLEIRI